MNNLIAVAQQAFKQETAEVPAFKAGDIITVRKISDGIGVERIFPVSSPTISKIELNKVGVVRRARIYYLRNLTGKKARIKEKKLTK